MCTNCRSERYGISSAVKSCYLPSTFTKIFCVGSEPDSYLNLFKNVVLIDESGLIIEPDSDKCFLEAFLTREKSYKVVERSSATQ